MKDSKQKFFFEKIRGLDVVFFVNRSGGMWYAKKDGKNFGSHEIYEGDIDIEEQIKMLRQMAKESL